MAEQEMIMKHIRNDDGTFNMKFMCEVVRCKDCKHRPTGTNRDDLEFPDEKCPCQCEDFWYSWKPSDNWYCGNGERKDGCGNG